MLRCSDALEEEGEVSGAADVPQHVVEEADHVQNLGFHLNKRMISWYFTLGSPIVASLLMSSWLSPTPRKIFLSSRLKGRVSSPGCQSAGSSPPSYEWELLQDALSHSSAPRWSPTPWRRPPASPSPWGSLPHTWIEMLEMSNVNQIEETHLG